MKRTIAKLLFAYEERFRTGAVFSPSQFTLGPGTARIPDVAFVSTERLELLPDADVAIPFAPNLAVEVISSSESADEAETKVRQYLAAGVEEVWQVYLKEQLFRIRVAGAIRDLIGEDILTSPVLPGFEAPVRRFFER